MTDLSATSNPSKRRARRNYKPITPEGLKGCCDYLEQARKGGNPDPALLVVGHDGSSIERAEVRFDADEGTPMIAFAVEGRSCRLVDPLSFLYLRLLAAGGGHFWLNDDDSGRHYLKLDLPRPWRKTKRTLSMTVLRLISDGGADLEAEQIGRGTTQREAPYSHYDLRRRNLHVPKVALPEWPEEDEHGRQKGRKRQRIKTERADAELAATKRFQKIRSRKAKLNIDGATFKKMLRNAASLINKLPFGASGKPI